MKQNKTKKVLACVLSVLAVAGFTVPANVETGGLFGSTEIVAKADYSCPDCGEPLMQPDSSDSEMWYCFPCDKIWYEHELGGNSFNPTLNATSITLEVGQTHQLSVEGGKTNSGSFGSNDERVATVDDSGMITAVGAGTATIAVMVEGYESMADLATLYCKVTVVAPPTLKEASITLNVGQSKQIEVTNGNIVNCKSSNGNVATVSGSGIITAVGEGTANIAVVVQTSSSETWVLACTVKVNSVSVEKAPTAKTLFYTGKPLELVTAGTASQGSSMRYSLDNQSWSADIPTGTDAGNYTVYYKAVRDGASDSEVGQVSVKIAKANPIVIAPTAKTLTYDGSALALVNAGTTTGGTLQYKLDDGSWSTSIPTAKDAGNYTVYYKVEGNSNYNGNNGRNIPVEIKKADYRATVALNDWIYKENPKDNTPVVSGLPQEVQNANPEIAYEYAPKGTNNWSSDVPVEEGEYTIRATIAQTANYNSQTATADFAIKLKEGFVHIQPNTPPTKEGKIFAGYFTDETCTKPYTGTDVAYAKFVDAGKYMKVDEPAFSVNGSKGTLQISALTPDSNVKEIRFEIKIGNSVKKVKADKLVKAESGCKAVYTLNNITKKYFGQTVTITPYWTTLDGTTITGTPTTYTISNNQ